MSLGELCDYYETQYGLLARLLLGQKLRTSHFIQDLNGGSGTVSLSARDVGDC